MEEQMDFSWRNEAVAPRTDPRDDQCRRGATHVDADEQRRFGESADDLNAASVGRARAADGGRIELTVDELAQVLDRPQPPVPPTGNVRGGRVTDVPHGAVGYERPRTAATGCGGRRCGRGFCD
ncbi:hypothetical protein GCM10009680_56470 [Streptomyces yatensis]|uniref:Uncharacterized protein n=1 Tax=Streptomyces yatensis TaxID=155177 RepID=A0ABN2IN87_9ACTN